MNTKFAANRKPFYHRVDNQAADWRLWHEDADGEVTLKAYDGDLALKDKSVAALPSNEPLGSFGGLTTPKGVIHRQNGIVLVVDRAHQQIVCYSPAIGQFKPLWTNQHPEPDSPYTLQQPTDILFSRKGELVICDAGKQQVIWLQWPTLRVKHVKTFAQHRPVAITASFDDGYLIALNAVKGASQPPQLVRVDTAYQQQKPLIFPDASVDNIAALTTLADHSVLILAAAKVWRLNQSGDFANYDPQSQLSALLPALVLKAEQLYQPNLTNPRCEPVLLGISGVNRQGQVLYTDAGQSVSKLSLVAVPKRLRISKSRRLISPPIEADTDQFSWDRLLLQSEILANTSVVIQSKTSDRLLSDEEISGDRQQPWSTAIRLDENTSAQVLVQSLPGRYLYLSLSMYGDGYTSSHIEAINIEGPRQSSLQWLPPAFHQDSQSRHFLDRFLSYFDVIFDQIGFQADHFARYLSPHSAPNEAFLNWLASWFDWQFFPATPIDKKREIISELMAYYDERGTLNGLKRLLRWYTGLSSPFPQIIEHFVFDRWRGQRDDFALAGRKRPLADWAQAHHFTVLIPLAVAPTLALQQRLTLMITAQKPVHCDFTVEFFQSRCVVGCQATIGTDMVIGNRTEGSLDHSVLGVDTLLAD